MEGRAGEGQDRSRDIRGRCRWWRGGTGDLAKERCENERARSEGDLRKVRVFGLTDESSSPRGSLLARSSYIWR